MTTPKYSTSDIQDLLNTANDIAVFLQAGVIEALDDRVMIQDLLLEHLADTINHASMLLTCDSDLVHEMTLVMKDQS